MADWWKNMSDEDLVANAGTNDAIATCEMLRRLRVSIGDLKTTLQAEEVAIKRLTWALVGMTAVLVVLTVLLVLHGG